MQTSLLKDIPIFEESVKGTKFLKIITDSSDSLLISELAQASDVPLIVVTQDSNDVNRIKNEVLFFSENKLQVLTLPDWETLPYDHFSPHQDIISNRLLTLYKLPDLKQGILIIPVSSLIQKLIPLDYLKLHSLVLSENQRVDQVEMRQRLTLAGYRYVEQVMEHGEFSIRGSLVDLFPMGSDLPYRIDLFDDEIESIKTFDADTQRSIESVKHIQLLPAREFPLDEDGISRFRQNWRREFDTSDKDSLYHRVSEGEIPAGIEYYLPYFHTHLNTLFDYLPENSHFYLCDNIHKSSEIYWQEINERYEQHRHDRSRPILDPKSLFLMTSELFSEFKQWNKFEETSKTTSEIFEVSELPDVQVDHQKKYPLLQLKEYIDSIEHKILICADSAGRRESIAELMNRHGMQITRINTWQEFLKADSFKIAVAIAPIYKGFELKSIQSSLVSENQLFGDHVKQSQTQVSQTINPDTIIRNLAELEPGDAVVHSEQGIGRYVGLQTLSSGNINAEYLTLEYAGGDKLYVPVHMLQLVSRYSGAGGKSTPLHRLGSEQWQKARKKAAERVRDVAAELLDLHARRASKPGNVYKLDKESYQLFSESFDYQTTQDQQTAIDAVISDLCSEKPMDRLVCGDVGFGKTEVAMRAAFVVTQQTKQVAILVPTTLLAQQHFESFKDRFANWPINVEMISRFRSIKEQNKIVEDVAQGKVDILIGTHKLLNKNIQYADLGLVVIDEEHRFGVSQKEKIKALRSEVDILTLTATPIPRTLNMSISGMRDLSIIASPPARRLAIKTFVREFSKPLIREAIMREIMRGGQVYFLHNDVSTIENTRQMLEQLIPEARINIGHGQMNKLQLEKVMSDFYHQRFNVLICSTIIETGIDVPTANTIIMDRADKLGLAQMHQLRGRVGRSHHQAYAFLLTPNSRQITKDAVKRLEAIASLGDLGSGFILATQDMEIRGAGELLGDEQSGQIQTIGFSLYIEMLEEAVTALKEGREPSLYQSLSTQTEVDLKLSALIPEDYVADVGIRLSLYKRIANASSENQLRELQVELIDRFGLLPENCKNLFVVSELKLIASPYGINKLEVGEGSGSFEFSDKAPIEPMSLIKLLQNPEHHCTMRGATKLVFTGEFNSIDEKFSKINTLLKSLEIQNA